MEKTVFISLNIDELQNLIIGCLNTVLKDNKPLIDNSIDAGQFLNMAQACAFLGLAKPTIYGLVHKKGIPVSKRGKKLYFSKSELTQWIESGRKKTKKEIDIEADEHLDNLNKE